MVVEPVHGGVGARFVTTARRCLGATGWYRPAAGQACVALFDSVPWAEYAAGASFLLELAELERAARFRFERERLAYVMAHAMWRLVLADTLQVDTREVPLSTTPSGQPVLRGTGIATSLSHSGSWVAIAVGRMATLGVDIECSPSPRALGDLLETICTPSEADALRQLSTGRREVELLALWTRKEALLKAFGTGLAWAPAGLSGAIGKLVPAPSATAYPACRVHSLDISCGVVGALAVPAGVHDGRLFVMVGVERA